MTTDRCTEDSGLGGTKPPGDVGLRGSGKPAGHPGSWDQPARTEMETETETWAGTRLHEGAGTNSGTTLPVGRDPASGEQGGTHGQPHSMQSVPQTPQLP